LPYISFLDNMMKKREWSILRKTDGERGGVMINTREGAPAREEQEIYGV